MVEECSAVEKSFCGVRYYYLALNDEFINKADGNIR
jgi:hypothetical protein